MPQAGLVIGFDADCHLLHTQWGCLHSAPVSPEVGSSGLFHTQPHVSQNHYRTYSFLLLEALEYKDFPGRQMVNFIREGRDAKVTVVYDTIKRRPKETNNTWAGVLSAVQSWPSLSPFWASISGLKYQELNP